MFASFVLAIVDSEAGDRFSNLEFELAAPLELVDRIPQPANSSAGVMYDGAHSDAPPVASEVVPG